MYLREVRLNAPLSKEDEQPGKRMQVDAPE
jgi:hypothetical protein